MGSDRGWASRGCCPPAGCPGPVSYVPCPVRLRDAIPTWEAAEEQGCPGGAAFGCRPGGRTLLTGHLLTVWLLFFFFRPQLAVGSLFSDWGVIAGCSVVR